MKIKHLLLVATVLTAMTSCSDDSNEPAGGDDAALSPKEQALKTAVGAYVDKTVLPTYASMADAAIELRDLCHIMRDKHAAGNLTTADIEAAGTRLETVAQELGAQRGFPLRPCCQP